MRSVLKKNRTSNSVYTQMLIIVIAFVIMGISSYLFASRTETRHLAKDAENALAITEAKLITNLLEPETLLNGYSGMIENMLISGESQSTIKEYLESIVNFSSTDNLFKRELDDVHGYFYRWGGVYLSGNNQKLPNNYAINDLEWYNEAVNAEGRTAITGPFRNISTGSLHLTFSQLIGNKNEPLAVICLDLELNRFSDHSNITLTEGSYGILLNNKLEILAFPDRNSIGLRLNRIGNNIAYISSELEMTSGVFYRRIKNMFNDQIVYFIRVKHGWYLGVVIPVNEYYISLTYLGIFLFIIGLLLAGTLCIMLYFIARAKMNSDLRTQQKSNFLATMSHEIRTPLNAILGMTEIQMQNSVHPPATSEAFIKINNSGKLLLNIINDILDLSKIESGKLELTPVKYEVANLINDIIQLNYIRYESKPIEFNINIDENIPATLVGDDLRIKQILNNLLSNAFKYTDKGEVNLSVNTECIGRGGGAVVVTLIFIVKDTGQGMTQEQVSKLFDEYTRFNMEANRTTEGAGLGMTITRNLVELMYGKINVKSAINEGTTVAVRLPQKTDGIGIRGILGREMANNLKQFRHDNAIQFKKTKINHEYMPYGHILIVDDVETNLYVAKGLMAPYGLKIDLATSGFEAIDKIKETGSYDIVFMDHMMPKMDGMETTKRIREMGYNRPVVALTANAIAGQVDMFLQNGFDDFISKPIDLRQLNVLLNRLIRDKQPKEVIEAAQNEKAELEKKSGFDTGHPAVDPQLAEIFARDAEKSLNIINSCIRNNLRDDNDLQMYIINVHAMKSALANIGERELSSKAQRLEQSGRENDINVIMDETGEFIELLNKVVNEIKLKNAEEETKEDSEENLVMLNDKLKIIKEACGALDKKAAKTALNELHEKKWSHETKALINSIAEHLLHSEFDETLALIEKYIK